MANKNYSYLLARTRSYLRDFSGSIFREVDIQAYLNEAIERVKEVVPELRGMTDDVTDGQDLTLMPDYKQYLLAVYAAARCFAQDENEYKGGTMMNEFEAKLDELREDIESGKIVITDENGDVVTVDEEWTIDYVEDVYYYESYEDEDDETEPVM